MTRILARATIVVALLALLAAGCSSPEAATVPEVTGMTVREASGVLRGAGLEYGYSNYATSEVPSDALDYWVTEQTPNPGYEWQAGETVYLHIEATAPSPSTAAPEEKTTPPAVPESVTFGTATVACDHSGEAQYPYGWDAHWTLGLIADRAESDGSRFVKASVTVENEYGALSDMTVECTVSGTETTATVTMFDVY